MHFIWHHTLSNVDFFALKPLPDVVDTRHIRWCMQNGLEQWFDWHATSATESAKEQKLWLVLKWRLEMSKVALLLLPKKSQCNAKISWQFREIRLQSLSVSFCKITTTHSKVCCCWWQAKNAMFAERKSTLDHECANFKVLKFINMLWKLGKFHNLLQFKKKFHDLGQHLTQADVVSETPRYQNKGHLLLAVPVH